MADHAEAVNAPRVVVVGASSGLGRCIGVGLGQRGARVALMARRADRLDSAAEQAGNGAVAVTCDVTDESSCAKAVEEAAAGLGGIDTVIYAPAIGPLSRIEDISAETWAKTFATNVTGASLFTSAALPHLRDSHGRVVYLSSVSASFTAPWPGLGAYMVSKVALEKLIEVWRVEHPAISFTRLVIGDCPGGEGDFATEFANGWDPDLMTEFGTVWFTRGLLAGCFLDVDEMVDAVDALVRSGPSVAVPNMVLAPRPQD